MSFLFPQLLWFLFAISIPVIIHFFNFRRVKVLEFSTLQFIEEVRDQTRRRRSLKHLLILISRILFISFLVLAFAQPVLNRGDEKSVGTVIYVDNSYSMSSEITDGRSALNESVDIIQSYLDGLPIEARLLLLTNDFDNNLNNWEYKRSISEKLTELTYSSSGRSFDKVVQRLDQIKSNYQLLYLSDFQKSTIGPPGSTDVSTKLIPIQYGFERNIYVDTLFFRDHVLFFDHTNVLEISLRNASSNRIDDLQIKLLNGNRLIGTRNTSIPARSKSPVSFEIDLKNLDSNFLKIEIKDYPVVFDNEYWLSLIPFEPSKVTYIFSGTPNQYIEEVYGNEQLFDFRSYSINELDYGDLASSNLVLLEGFEVIPKGIANSSNAYDIVLIPPEDLNLKSYSDFLNASLVPKRDSLLRDISAPDLNDPIFTNVFERSLENNDLPKAKILFNISTGSHLLKTRFDDSFLSRFNVERRNLYLMACPLSVDFTSLPTHSLFLPLFYRIAQFSKQAPEPLAYTADQRVFTISSAKIQSDEIIKIAGPENEFIPNYNLRSNMISLELPPSKLSPGYYHVISGVDTIRSLAINHSKKESDLQRLTGEELLAFANSSSNLEILELNNSGNYSQQIHAGLSNVRLWKYALFLALVFVIAEILLVRFL